MKILDGKIAKEHYINILKEKINKLTITPCLVILQVGSHADSDSFIKAKKSLAEKIGIKEMHIKLPEDVNQEDLINEIKKYNKVAEVHGIIVQLPLPKHLNPDLVIEHIDPKKDVDGLTKDTLFMPATSRGIKELCEFYEIELKNKKVTVIGKSKLVGKPIAEMCKKEGAIVTACDSATDNIPEKAKEADILIVAIGKPRLIDHSYIKHGGIVIDVGITRVGESLHGDVDFEKAKNIVSMITPVPGGVGQMTVLSLFENLVDACYNANININ